MRLGTIRGFLAEIGYSKEEMYKSLAEAGISSVDYGLSYGYQHEIWKLSDEELREELEEDRKNIEKNGLIVGQTHSPLDAYWGNQPDTKEARLHAQIQAIKAASYLNSPYIVIHPICLPGRMDRTRYEENKKLNMEYYRYLEPYLRKYHVKAAIENLFIDDRMLGRTAKTACSTAENLMDYIDTLGSDQFVACLDVGHAVLAGEDPVEMIYKLGKKYLHVTHMHDNDYINDDHMMPGIGKIDWYAVGKALNDIGYEGVFNYEAPRTYQRLGPFAKQLTADVLRVYVELGKAITSVK